MSLTFLEQPTAAFLEEPRAAFLEEQSSLSRWTEKPLHMSLTFLEEHRADAADATTSMAMMNSKMDAAIMTNSLFLWQNKKKTVLHYIVLYYYIMYLKPQTTMFWAEN